MAIKELKGINKRPRYFAGQYLLEDDFELQQDYSRDRLQRYTRSLHVSGIADGLIASKPNDATLKLSVDISAGTALDPQGRQVVLLESRQVDLTKDLVETVKLDDGFYILSIGYDEQETEPQDGNTSTNWRILENPLFKLIKFSTSPPSEDSIAIAKLTIKDGIVAISSDSSVRKYTGLRLPALENAPTLRSKGGNLAVFSGSLEIAGTQIVGSTTLENHLYLSGGTGHFAQFYRNAIEGKDYLGIEAFNQNDSTTKTAIVLQEFGGNVGIGGAPASGANAEKLKVAGNTTIAGTLSITGANNSLNVEGTSTLTNNVGIGGAPSTGTEKLKVTGNTTIAGNLSVTGTDKKLTVEGNLRLGTNAGGSKLLLTHADYTHYIQANNYWTEFVSHPNEGWRFIARNDEKDATSLERLTVTGSGKVAIAGTLSVTSTSTLTGKVGIGGDPSAGSEKLKVTGDATIAGNLTVAGKYVVQNNEDGGKNRGIFMWHTDDSNWGIYMGTSGDKKSLSGGTAVKGNNFSSHAIRLRTYSEAGNGLIYENSKEELNFSVRANDGRTYIRGNAGIGTDPTDAERLTVGGNTAIVGTLSVTGASNNLTVEGTSTLTNNVGIGGAPSTGTEKLKVTGNTTIAGTLSVTGTSTLNGNTTIAGTSTLTGNVGVGGDPGSTEKLKVSGDAAIAGSLSTTGDQGDLTISGTSKLNGTTTIAGKLKIGEALTISEGKVSNIMPPPEGYSYAILQGAVNITTSNDSNYANKLGFMAPGSLTIGSVNQNYGGGQLWHSNTAGLLLETQDNTEIAIHDASRRVASFMYYEGAENKFTIGRDMGGGWGANTKVDIAGSLSVSGTSTLTGETTIVGPLFVSGENGKMTVAGQCTINGDTTIKGALATNIIHLGPNLRIIWKSEEIGSSVDRLGRQARVEQNGKGGIPYLPTRNPGYFEVEIDLYVRGEVNSYRRIKERVEEMDIYNRLTGWWKDDRGRGLLEASLEHQSKYWIGPNQ